MTQNGSGVTVSQQRYDAEAEALRIALTNIISGASRLLQAIDEAKAKNMPINFSNYETTISVSYRLLLKGLGMVQFMQTLAIQFRKKVECR